MVTAVETTAARRTDGGNDMDDSQRVFSAAVCDGLGLAAAEEGDLETAKVWWSRADEIRQLAGR
jgi:hypothetical protein